MSGYSCRCRGQAGESDCYSWRASSSSLGLHLLLVFAKRPLLSTSLHVMPALDSRFVSLIGSCFVALAAGTPYLYGVYSPQLMAHCGFTASDSSIFSFATNIGSSIGGLPAGLFIDKYGTRVAILVGGCCKCFGFLSLYLSFTYQLHYFWLIFVAMICIGLGSVLSYFSTLKAATANFPHHRGTASALPVSSYGLSALIYSAIAAFCFNNNTGGLLHFICIFVGVVICSGSYFVKVVAHDDADNALRSPTSPNDPSNGINILDEEQPAIPKPISKTKDEEHGYGTFLMGHRGSFANIDMVRNDSQTSLFSYASQFSQSTTSLSTTSTSSFRPSSIPIKNNSNNQDGLFIRGAYDASPFRSYGNSPSYNYLNKSSLSSSPLINYNSQSSNTNNANITNNNTSSPNDGPLMRNSSFINSMGSSPSIKRGYTNSNLTSSIKKTGSFLHRGQSFNNNTGISSLGLPISSRKSFKNESDSVVDEEAPLLKASTSASNKEIDLYPPNSITNTTSKSHISSSPASSTNSYHDLLRSNSNSGLVNGAAVSSIGPQTEGNHQVDLTYPSTSSVNEHAVKRPSRTRRSKKQKFTSASHVKSLITNKFFISHYVLNSLYCACGQLYIFCVGFIVKAQLNYNPEDFVMQSMNSGFENQLLKFLIRNKGFTTVLNCMNLTLAAAGIIPPMPIIDQHAFAITEQKDLSSAYQALQVSIVSFSNFLGRFISGPLSDLFHKKLKVQRIWVLVFSLTLMSIGHYNMIYVDQVASLSLASFLIGCSYGSAYGTYPAITVDYFGTKGFTTTWGLLGTGSIISFLCLSTIFGNIYDSHSVLVDGAKVCYEGKYCYNSVFKLTTCVCILLYIGFGTIIFIKKKK